jgi:pimeloyl-ACP methyl ester carboxylesterase
MNEVVRDRLDEARKGDADRIRRRHVLYVSGYDPRGAQGYFNLFQRTCKRFQSFWPVSLTVQPIGIDSDAFAHWAIDLRAPDWQVTTHYDFLRTEAHIRADMEGTAPGQALRALGWYAGDVVSGAQLGIFRASWRFAVHLLCFQFLALAWAAVAVMIGIASGYALVDYLSLPVPLGGIAGFVAAFVALFALRPLAQRWRLIQISSCWSTLRRFGRGRATWLDQVIEAGAQRVIAVARANEADELAVVGHSTGGVIAAAIVARALELDPAIGCCGPRLALLTLGSVMPAVALHPAARRMRAIVGKLAIAKDLAWIDCQSRKDVMCFANFDPVSGTGVDAGPERCNPALWRITFKDMIAPEDYNRFRWNHFRVHYQYVMAGDRPAPYDYILLVGGPMPITQWPDRDREFMAALLQDAPPPGERVDAAAIGAAP